ncbi:MAG: adenosylcobinamide-GDP ribazoletransferase [Hyphomicrobium sp.]|nr:adenosylcobinamide-GDP ribazoletransferase [Hyphomicrobium sp.]
MFAIDWIRQRFAEIEVAVVFLTRLPLTRSKPIDRGDVARALWSAPIVGGLVGALGGAVYMLFSQLHLPALPAAALAIATTVGITGCLHEDGLADVADGFGGGATRERKLEIMRDSRIGTYGVCALVLSFVLRISALASLRDPGLVFAALIAAQAAARAGLAAFMRYVAAARADGLSASAGIPPRISGIAAIALGLVALSGSFGVTAGLVALVALACLHGAMAWLCQRQIQGQTGDVLGAVEQIGEIAVLLIAAALAGM